MSISINGVSDKKTMPSSVKEYFQMKDIFEFMKEDIFELSSSNDNDRVPALKEFYIDPQEIKKYLDRTGKLGSFDDAYSDALKGDDIFSTFDAAIQQMKKDAEEHAKYMKEYREMIEKRKRIQKQKALDNIDLMKKTGKLRISGFTPVAAQLVMSETPQKMSDFRTQEKYKKRIIDNKQQIYDNREEYYEKKFEDLEDMKKDIEI